MAAVGDREPDSAATSDVTDIEYRHTAGQRRVSMRRRSVIMHNHTHIANELEISVVNCSAQLSECHVGAPRAVR